MLHITVMNPHSKQKRAEYRTELKEPKDWRVEIDVEKGRAYYRPNYGRHGLEPDKFEIDCIRDGRIILGSDNLQVISAFNYIDHINDIPRLQGNLNIYGIYIDGIEFFR